ncbi:hypothetical protein GCM10011516_14690 [Sphingobacterium cellulitidis]|uniref:Uncharacterized protein n=1 Tax=Sphingobacterium cellulitidis TaxID=1768011 RepID=A0A8H9G0Z2_9SPHI|nr:hypothetical protein GCM10011516_14690 [Sphingobacterium soli]
MGKRTEFSLIIPSKIPDDRREKIDWRLDKEVPLALYPLTVQPQENRPGTFGSIGDIEHGTGIYRIASARAAQVIEIDAVKF